MKIRKINRVLVLAMLTVMIAGITSGCGMNTSDKATIICTTFPEYDWVINIIGDDSEKFEAILLSDNGVDIHSYQPSAADIVRINHAAMVVYVGGESDKWVDEAISAYDSPNRKVINLLEILGDKAYEEEIIEGMSAESKEAKEDETEYDEHVWMSLSNAKLYVGILSDTLCELDSDNKDKYKSNTEKYIDKLSKLDEKYKETVENAKYDTILVCDRFPFRYLTESYGISYYAAFSGCSADVEASFETIKFLVGKLDELGLPAMFIIDNSDEKLAVTVKNSTKQKNQEILVLDSMQSVTRKKLEEGYNYVQVMEDNLKMIARALNP